MILPNWLKIAWWMLILAVLSTLLWSRRSYLLEGKATPFDIIAFIIWICLMLVPIFAEIKIFGFEFTQKIEDLEKHIDRQIATLTNEVRTNVDLRTQINPQFTFTTPPQDSQLPNIERNIREILEREVEARGITTEAARASENVLPEDPTAIFLFTVRRAIDRELRRICLEKFGDEGSCRRSSASLLLNSIQRQQLLSHELAQAVRDLYAVCSPSIHGEDATPDQLKFAEDVSPGILAALRAV
jgi:hypothetical protein